jgi:hypothetical protein
MLCLITNLWVAKLLINQYEGEYNYVQPHSSLNNPILSECFKKQNPDTGIESLTFSVITTEANPLITQIHNVRKRMPVILPLENE